MLSQELLQSIVLCVLKVVGALIAISLAVWAVYRWMRSARLHSQDRIRERLLRWADGGVHRRPLWSSIRRYSGVLVDLVYESLLSRAEGSLLQLVSQRKSGVPEYLRRAGLSGVAGYRRLIVGCALGIPRCFEVACRWIRQGRWWHKLAAVHALARWPGEEADGVLVDALVREAQRRSLPATRWLIIPMLGALAARRGQCLEAVVAKLREVDDPRVATVLVSYLARVSAIPEGLWNGVEQALADWAKRVDYELAARVLEAARSHGLPGFKEMAVGCLAGGGPEFVRLWAVRYLKRIEPQGSWRLYAAGDDSEMVRREISEA